jgi:hypothetical protein
MLPKFVAAYPEITVEVLVEGFTDIVARRTDAGIRPGESLVDVAVPERSTRMAVVATPATQKHGTPKTPRDLRSQCITRLVSAGTPAQWEFERGAEKIEIAVEPPISIPVKWCLMRHFAGMGLGYSSEERAADATKSRALIRVSGLVPTVSGFSSATPTPAASLAAVFIAIRWRGSGTAAIARLALLKPSWSCGSDCPAATRTRIIGYRRGDAASWRSRGVSSRRVSRSI